MKSTSKMTTMTTTMNKGRPLRAAGLLSENHNL